jgi:hypothetical protein
MCERFYGVEGKGSCAVSIVWNERLSFSATLAVTPWPDGVGRTDQTE